MTVQNTFNANVTSLLAVFTFLQHRMWRQDSVSTEASPVESGYEIRLHVHLYAGLCSVACLEISGIFPPAFVPTFHRRWYLHSVSLHAGGCFHVHWIGLLTSVNGYAQHRLCCEISDYALTFAIGYHGCQSRKPLPHTEFQNHGTVTTLDK